jgi:hypothetical protein
VGGRREFDKKSCHHKNLIKMFQVLKLREMLIKLIAFSDFFFLVWFLVHSSFNLSAVASIITLTSDVGPLTLHA